MSKFGPFCTMLLFFSGSFSTYADVAVEPLRTYAASPYQSSSLSTQLRSAFQKQDVEVFFHTSMASVWAHSHDFSLDYYQNQVQTGIQWQVNSRVKTEIMYQYSWARNNGLDSFVMNFHDAFNIGQNGRDQVAEDRFHIHSDTYGFTHENFEDDVFVNGMHVNIEFLLHQTAVDAWSIGGTLYMNGVDESFVEGGFEQGVQLNYSRKFDNSVLFSTVGVTHRGDKLILGEIEARDFTGAFALGYSYQLNPRHHLIGEYHLYQGGADDDSEFSKASHELVVGYRYHYELVALELTVTENMRNMDNSTDILFGAGIRVFFAKS
ncbi:DUF3187 family protein [Vibrio panuliri]|uniref:DUF3187 family protein n=1 Tax=Vibrio panuliri TaxID=1381081 RepID=A0ABX3FQZ1_9VIBR|nr:DUF3187 family protein [Vibrio panuliri]OLQ96327.1 hypothetical protein BIY20_04960 [Vibrio panuliri]